MSHHGDTPFSQSSSEIDPQRKAKMEQLVSEINRLKKLGPTGNFPQGKLDEADDGEIKIAIGNKEQKVFISFGKSVLWIAFDVQQARDIALALNQHADSVIQQLAEEGKNL